MRWKETRESWSKTTSLSSDVSRWASDSLVGQEDFIIEIEEKSEDSLDTKGGQHEKLKSIKKSIKRAITAKENDLDDLVLNTPNSYKLQLSVPSNLNYLMKAWAAAEGRDLSSVAMQCLEAGLREMKRKGSIPEAAIRRYDMSCEKRIALAEINNLWDQHEQKLIDGVGN